MAATEVDTSAQATYHVRLICPWPSTASSPLSRSFFGLELELHGFDPATGAPVVVFPFELDGDSETTSTPGSSHSAMVGPLQLVVRAKLVSDVPNLSDQQEAVLQRMAAVQPGNAIVGINNVRFLRSSHSTSDVLAQLRRVSRLVGLGRPFTLTLQRHNHTQASTKIVPFAARADVQAAQLAQFDRLQAQESTLGEHVKRKKQFILQQLDYEREHYLYDHIGMQLHELHDSIMARGQWQAYEFERALWYFHAPSRALFAEHPMRNDPRTRQLIGCALLRTRFAVIKLQRGARAFLHRTALVERAVSDPRLVDAVWTQYLWEPVWETLWRKELAPLMARKTPRVLSIDQEAERVLAAWRGARQQQAKAANNRTVAFDLSFRGGGGDLPPAKTTVSTATSARKSDLNDASTLTDPLSPRGPGREAPVPTLQITETKKETASTAVGSARVSVFHSGTQSEVLPLSQFDVCTQVDLAYAHRVEEAVQTELKTPRCDAGMQTDVLEMLEPVEKPHGSDTGETVGEWRSYLHLLKTNLARKKQRKSPVHRGTQTEFPRSNDGGSAAPLNRKRPSFRQKPASQSLNHNPRSFNGDDSQRLPQRVDSFSEYCRSLAFPQQSPEVGDPGAIDADDDLAMSWRRRVQMRQQQQILATSPSEEQFLLPEYGESPAVFASQRGSRSVPAPASLRSAGFDPFDRPDARFRRALDSLLAQNYDLGEHTIEHSSSNSSLLDMHAVGLDSSSHGRHTASSYSYPQQHPATSHDATGDRRAVVPPRQTKSPPIAKPVPPVYLQMVKELERSDGGLNANASLTKLPYITRKHKKR
jgi:hypothetical protein